MFVMSLEENSYVNCVCVVNDVCIIRFYWNIVIDCERGIFLLGMKLV